MYIHKLIYSQILIFFSVLTIIGCNSTDNKESTVTEKKNSVLVDSYMVVNEETALTDTPKIDTLEIIVIQCANGYEYAMHNYDFNPVVEKELNKFDNIKVKPFPLKTLMGVVYQGVFDKKYCPPIIEKVDVDFLILTRFDKRYDELNGNQMKWGYELRILNTETLEQVNTISAYDLNDYSEIEMHIQENIEKLKSDIDLIGKMSEHHLKSGGKRLRALLTLESAKLTGYKEDNRDINLAACVELIHSATLLHDDVIDESSLRRGVKTTNSIWGNQSSILVGDYLLSRCFGIMVQDGDLEVLQLLSSTSAKIAQGEVLQLQHKGEADLLEETYIDIINLKTAALFSAATKTGACISGSNEKEKKALESYGRNLGLAFQIADDALDYYAKEKFFGKEIGKDFYEGKVTLPLITIFQKGNEEEKEFLTEIMKKDKRTEEDFSETLALIFKYKAVETSLKKAEYFVNVSYDALAIFPDSEDKRILQNLTSFSLNRSF